MRYSEVVRLLSEEGFDVRHYTHSAPLSIHRLMGVTYVGVKYQDVGSGTPIEYDEHDVRRAVAGLRLRRLLGSTVDPLSISDKSRLIERVASERRGWVLWAAGLRVWFDDPEELARAMSRANTAFIVIPCYVRSLEQLHTSA